MAENYKSVISDKKQQANRLMNEDQLKKCNLTIHIASAASAAAGAVPIPVVDAIPITTAQITMVLALGKVFDTEITESAAKGLIGAVASTFVGRNFIKFLPIVGWGISAVVAAGITEAIGWVIAVDLAKTAKSKWENNHPTTPKSAPKHEQTQAPPDDVDSKIALEQLEARKASLAKRADEFLSGEKKRSEHEDEFSTLLSDFEDILSFLPVDDPLRKKYDDLTLIIE